MLKDLETRMILAAVCKMLRGASGLMMGAVSTLEGMLARAGPVTAEENETLQKLMSEAKDGQSNSA